MNFPRLTVLASLLLAAVGCGPRYTPIKGIVLIDGKPVSKNTTLSFMPMQNTPMGACMTRDDTGRFILWDMQSKGGLLPGEYKVVITNTQNFIQMPEGDPSDPNDPRWEKYQKELERLQNAPPKPGMIPRVYASGATTPLRLRVPDDGSEVVFELKSGIAPGAKN